MAKGEGLTRGEQQQHLNKLIDRATAMSEVIKSWLCVEAATLSTPSDPLHAADALK